MAIAGYMVEPELFGRSSKLLSKSVCLITQLLRLLRLSCPPTELIFVSKIFLDSFGAKKVAQGKSKKSNWTSNGEKRTSGGGLELLVAKLDPMRVDVFRLILPERMKTIKRIFVWEKYQEILFSDG